MWYTTCVVSLNGVLVCASCISKARMEKKGTVDEETATTNAVQCYCRTTSYIHSLGTALSDHVLSLSQASQSERVVGSRPMALTFQIPSASMRRLVMM